MKKVFTVLGVAVLVLVLSLAGFVGYFYFKIKTAKDTHNLAEKVAAKCNHFIDEKKSVGLAIGIIQGDKVYANGFGRLDKNSGKLVNTNTIFEIGSITKVFTAGLAQILADKGIIKWDDNICDILPAEYRPAQNDGTTLLSLATHTSGFPRIPQPILDAIKNHCNPYADIKVADYDNCIKYMSGKKKPNPDNYAYSNMGFSVLANCLEVKTGCTYDSLLHREILNVLGMHKTTLQTSDTLNFATGYDKSGQKTCHWDFPVMYGAGAIHSTISDMLIFLRVNLTPNSLYGPFSETQKQIYKIPNGGIGKGWRIDKINGAILGMGNIIWHNGQTGGFHSYMALLPEKKIGIVILSNQSSEDLDKMGMELLVDASLTSLK